MSRYAATTVFVSTGESPVGIHAFKYGEDLDAKDGCWTRCHTYEMSPPPVYLRWSEIKNTLYALNTIECVKNPGKTVGKLHAIKIDQNRNGKMILLNAIELEGEEAFCLCFSPGDQHVVVGLKGSIATYILGPMGELVNLSHVHKSCQVESGTIYHAFPTQLEFVRGELGPAKIVVLNTAEYSNVMIMLDFDMRFGAIVNHSRKMPSWTNENGITKFALDSDWYVIHKLTSTFSVFLAKNQSSSEERPTVPDAPNASDNIVQDIIVPYKGQFIYVSNLGHNSLAIFRYSLGARVDPADPLFKLMPDGVPPTFMGFEAENLFVASDDNIYVFEINPSSGQLNEATPPKIEILKPICMAVTGKCAVEL